MVPSEVDVNGGLYGALCTGAEPGQNPGRGWEFTGVSGRGEGMKIEDPPGQRLGCMEQCGVCREHGQMLRWKQPEVQLP